MICKSDTNISGHIVKGTLCSTDLLHIVFSSQGTQPCIYAVRKTGVTKLNKHNKWAYCTPFVSLLILCIVAFRSYCFSLEVNRAVFDHLGQNLANRIVCHSVLRQNAEWFFQLNAELFDTEQKAGNDKRGKDTAPMIPAVFKRCPQSQGYKHQPKVDKSARVPRVESRHRRCRQPLVVPKRVAQHRGGFVHGSDSAIRIVERELTNSTRHFVQCPCGLVSSHNEIFRQVGPQPFAAVTSEIFLILML